LDILASQRRLSHPVVDLESVTDLDSVRSMQLMVLDNHVTPRLQDYLLDLIDHTRQDRRLALGVSPRGSLALFRGAQALAALQGREYVVPEDIKELFIPIMRKRVILASDQAMRGVDESQVLNDILDSVDVPVLGDEE
jgi:MoxR-like ATPase